MKAEKGKRMMKAVEEAGLPRLKSPFEFGNLFIILNIEFPTSLDTATQASLAKLLPPPMHKPTASEDDEDVEVCELKDIDPLWSYTYYKQDDGADGSDDEGGGQGRQQVQCAQQ